MARAVVRDKDGNIKEERTKGRDTRPQGRGVFEDRRRPDHPTPRGGNNAR